MKLTDLIDRIYVINLPERLDRKAQISNELKSQGIDWNPSQVICWPAIRPESAAGFPTLGTHGCFLSHLAALQDALSLSKGWVLILEDDAVFLPHLLAALPKLSKLLTLEQADLIYLGSCQHHETSADLDLFSLSQHPIVGAHAYMVSRPFLNDLIPYLQACLTRPAGHPLGGRLHFDGALSLYRQFNPTCRTWLPQHNLVEQRFSRSDIQPHWWYDQWPLIRQLAAWARQFKQHQRHSTSKL
jgi:glycosyl transferase family 25